MQKNEAKQFIEEHLWIIEKILFSNTTNKTIWDVLWQVDFIIKWEELCKLNKIEKEDYCNKFWLDKILRKYLEEEKDELYEQIIWFIEDHLFVKEEIKNKKSRLYNYITKWRKIDNYTSCEFSPFIILEAIIQIWNIKLISKDMYDIIILTNNKLRINLFLNFLYNLKNDDKSYIKNNTIVLQRLESHLSKEEIIQLKLSFE